MTRRTDHSGKRFDRLVVVGPTDRPAGVGGRDAYWLCLCDCGASHVVAARGLIHGNVRSCGCLQRERAAAAASRNSRTHGRSNTPEYIIWCGMISRCENRAGHAYDRYGGRGISVCPRWRRDFADFLNDVGPRPSKAFSLDRIDNDGNYEPNNCRWATKSQQSRNRRDRFMVTFRGRTMMLVDWSRELGIGIATLHDRIFKHGWTVERALLTDPRKYHRRP